MASNKASVVGQADFSFESNNHKISAELEATNVRLTFSDPLETEVSDNSAAEMRMHKVVTSSRKVACGIISRDARVLMATRLSEAHEQATRYSFWISSMGISRWIPLNDGDIPLLAIEISLSMIPSPTGPEGGGCHPVATKSEQSRNTCRV